MNLSDEGERLIAGVFAEHERDMERAASALTPTERATLVRLLKKLGLAAERMLTDEAAPKETHGNRSENVATRRSRRR